MDLELKACRSLPPLVEGKIYGYLELVIDEIIWLKTRSGDVSVVASWWGESDSAQFRPVDIISDADPLDKDTTETYAIRTNLSLFEEYIKNCETIELVIIDEQTHHIVGTSQVTELLDIFASKTYYRYLPIYNSIGYKIGEVHVSIKLLNVIDKLKCKQLKGQSEDSNVYSVKIQSKYNPKQPVKYDKGISDIGHICCGTMKSDTKDIYKSIIKQKQTELKDPMKKFNIDVADKLVAQVLARAQRLRGALLKNTYNDDLLALSDNSITDEYSCGPTECEAKLYEYFLGKEMSPSDQRKALSTLRSTSPTPSLIDLASETIMTCHNNPQVMSNQVYLKNLNETADANLCKEEVHNKLKDVALLDHIDSISVFVESLTLSPAGYRRVKSSCLSRNDGIPMAVTYIIQYNTTFGLNREVHKKGIDACKPTKMCSKKQIGEVIYFNHEGIYDIPKSSVSSNVSLQFKVFIRHINQKLPTEFGTASVYMSDIIKTDNLSIMQRLAVINKGIKVGELKVIVELGCDFAHFGKQYVDAVMSTKENIPVLELSPLNTEARKYKSATGTQSKTNSNVSETTARKAECVTTDDNTNSVTTVNIVNHQEKKLGNKEVDTKSLESNSKNKILLHGLIYIAEGKDLPELNTYLICRAFWREDKTASQLYTNTKNPFYHFSQLIPLIHGTDLLERIKDNYVIVEVHCKTNNDIDHLLGIVKLPVHQLYVAYRDPLILPHLLLSKYPIISVDEWVSITNPVTGQSCGQLLALVALGTAEQIALLGMSRGLRNITTIPLTVSCSPQSNSVNCTNDLHYLERGRHINNHESSQNPDSIPRYNSHVTYDHISDTNLKAANFRTQEIQTDISIVQDAKLNSVSNNLLKEEFSNTEQLVLHALVDRLAHALRATKTNVNQAAQTELGVADEKESCIEELSSNQLNCNTLSDDISSDELHNSYDLPTEAYRSVGVGAEIDEAIDQQQSASENCTVFPKTIIKKKEHTTEAESDQNNYFRSVIEIDCALHLPKIEKATETIEPSTYVTFQKTQANYGRQLHSYIMTNVYPHCCDPKWKWRQDVKLPIDLLLNNGKRLILKVWRLLDPDTSMEINLEQDIVIGFAAIDLSVLLAGFPSISGWFHIMDFTGKSNGQIKASITPLHNLSSFGKSYSTMNTVHAPTHYLPHSSHTQEPSVSNIDSQPNRAMLQYDLHDKVKYVENEGFSTDTVTKNDKHILDETSMSFLSLSLKQKLLELDEITKRLQTRLHDVTNTAFEDDFEADFDVNDLNSDNENTENKNNIHVGPDKDLSQTQPVKSKFSCTQNITVNEIQTKSATNVCEELPESNSGTELITFGTICVEQTNCQQSDQALSHNDGITQCHSKYSLPNDTLSNSSTEYPHRGTKTHINYLLDKLSSQFPSTSLSCEQISANNNIIDLFTNVHNDDNMQAKPVFSFEKNIDTSPSILLGMENRRNNTSSQNQRTNQPNVEINIMSNATPPDISLESQSFNKVSSLIREELITEENNDNTKYDELTTYLITSNVRHMGLDNIFNPLLYKQMASDLQGVNTASTEGEAIQQLDNRYVKTFSDALNNGLSRVQNVIEKNCVVNEILQSCDKSDISECPQDANIFPLSPHENINDKMDLKIIHKCHYDLMTQNSTESTSIISTDTLSNKTTGGIETDKSCSISSDSTVPTVSRQAPDGCNPVEENMKPLIMMQEDDFQELSSSS